MGRTTLYQLTAMCLVSSSVPSVFALSTAIHAAQAMSLLPRATSSCSVSGYQSCNRPGIQSNFCCPSGSKCISFNNDASVVCCPSGDDCKIIAPLTCDIKQQNATLHPSNQLHSTDLQGTLQPCGNACCPKGYSCQNSQCIMKTSSAFSSSTTSSKVTTMSSKPTSPTTGKSTSTPSSTATSAASGQETTPSAECNKFPVPAILAGFFPGLLLGILLTVLVVLCLGRRRRRSSRHSRSDLSSVTATVSDPIYRQENNAFRTDFLRRESKTKYRTSRVRSLFSRSPAFKHSDSIGRSLRSPIRTPELRKEPSMESIKIYSPPNGGLGRPQTTFTDMMVDAGFRPGEPYIRTPPRARGGGQG